MDSLQTAYRDGRTTPEEVMENLVRQAKTEEEKNIWITPPKMERIRPYLDKLNEIGQEELPLWGVPFAIKDNIDAAGMTTTAGCPDYAYTPKEHAQVVERLIRAGAVPVGKTNLDQFATGLVGTRSPYGDTHNSLRPELISGGSSAGSAAAVGRGQVVFALGTDTAGSGRVPAALNGITGWKPNCGAWPVKGVVPACESLDCVTVFAHTLSEALVVDQAVRGEEAEDPWSKAWESPVLETPETILLPEEEPAFYGPFADAYRQAWNTAVEQWKKSGVPVSYIDTSLFSEAAAILYGGPWIAERWAALGDFVESNPGSTFPVTEDVLRSGAGTSYDAASVFHAMHRLQRLKKQAAQILDQAVLVLPTCGGTWYREDVRRNPIQTNSDMGRFTNHCNLLDLSAVAVPAGNAAEDLPFGITIFGRSDKEGLAAGAAAAFSGTPVPKEKKNLRQAAPIAVCGLHMRGFELESQMREHGASFLREDRTAPVYQMLKLPGNPAKPGLVRKQQGGASIHVEVWEIPLDQLGSFTTGIPAPLAIGNVELESGEQVPGFVCEGYAEHVSEDITDAGSWASALK
ncbi:allophanate hydrolase [Salibacterium halotolerans]|uniref:Allophanate hydrolase n=1 Tax=Salibacterium halotolerans TaxID=1884432 RepID=A0A1I5XKS9_9BACI|nr:allophanate hydrolase [Salibacterium halotolerans]SFQ32534.1 allophanate hydrolase [Salibacterium halotolerans]